RRQAVGERANPQEASAADDRHAPALVDFGDGARPSLGPLRGVEGLERLGAVDQMMWGALPLLRAGLPRPDVEVTIDLNAVRADDLAAGLLGELDSELGLTGCSRTHDDEQLARAHRLPTLRSSSA